MSATPAERSANRLRLAIGLLTASEWDAQDDHRLDACRAYLSTSDEDIEELVWGLVMLARAGLGNQAKREGRSLLSVLQDAARSTVACP